MNAVDVLKYGHLTILRSLDAVPAGEWETPNVCGVWSTREIVAHLASFEQLLVELLAALLAEQQDVPPPAAAMIADPQKFNDDQVGQRQPLSPAAVLAEYNEAQARTMTLAAQIPAEKFRRNGLLPWYGREYDLDDFLAYSYYGHKREHSAQINIFTDRL